MNSLFVLKCIVQEHPITMICSLWIITVLIFSYVIRILEQDNPDYDFINYYNSIWYCLVTLTSIGYGDFYPISPLGKICNTLILSRYSDCNMGSFLHFFDDSHGLFLYWDLSTRTQSDELISKGKNNLVWAKQQLKAEKVYMKTLTKLLSILYKLRKIIHSKETK
jgi:hypothetical protein